MATIAELLLEKARQESDAQRTQGALANQTWQHLADIVSGTGRQIQQERIEAPIRAQEAQLRGLNIQNMQGQVQERQAAEAHDKAFRDAIMGGVPDEDLNKIDPERANKFIAGRDAIVNARQTGYANRQKILHDVTEGLAAVPEDMRADAYAQKRKELIDNQVLKETDAPPQFDPQWFQQTLNFARTPEMRAQLDKINSEIEKNKAEAGKFSREPAEKAAKSLQSENDWMVDGRSQPVIFDPASGARYLSQADIAANKPLDPSRLRRIPPASAQHETATLANWSDDQIDFYAQQIKSDASKLSLINGLEKPVKDKILRRISTMGGDVNKISESSRIMSEMAKEILPHIDTIQAEAQQLDKLGLIGPIGSRWRDFLAGKIGAGELAGGNSENAALIGKFKTDAGLLKTAVARAHGGARGGGSPQMLEHMNNLFGSDKADLSTLTGELSGFKDWMQGYAGMLPSPSAGASATGGLPSVGATFQGGKVLKVEKVQ